MPTSLLGNQKNYSLEINPLKRTFIEIKILQLHLACV